MKPISALRSSLAALALAAAADAFAYGGTSAQTIAAGGSLNYDPSTAAGSSLRVEARGGYYLFDGFLVGGAGSVSDDDAASCYELAAYCQYHLLQLVGSGNDSPGGFSPYVGARLGLAHGKNDYGDSATGALAAIRLGAEVFFTDNVALDLAADVSACTGDVFPDDDELKGSDVAFRAGLSFHF